MDDGERFCDLDRARDVVLRSAPQDNSVGRGRSRGGMVAGCTAADGWRMTGSALRGTVWREADRLVIRGWSGGGRARRFEKFEAGG